MCGSESAFSSTCMLKLKTVNERFQTSHLEVLIFFFFSQTIYFLSVSYSVY